MALFMLFGLALSSCTKEFYAPDMEEEEQFDGIELRIEEAEGGSNADGSDGSSDDNDGNGDEITDDDDEDDDDELEDEKKGN